MKKFFKNLAILNFIIILSIFIFPSDSKASEETATAKIDKEVADIVNFREDSDENSKILDRVDSDDTLVVLGNDNGWLRVKLDDKEGYVGAYWFDIDGVVGFDTEITDYANFRKKPSMDSIINEVLDKGKKLSILDYESPFYKVNCDGKIGYVHEDFIDLPTPRQKDDSEKESEEESKESKEDLKRESKDKFLHEKNYIYGYKGNYIFTPPAPQIIDTDTVYRKALKVPKINNQNIDGSDVFSFASQFVGNPYVWGGSSLTNGADCSGFVMSVYSYFGISLPHKAQSQYYYGTPVSIDEVQNGDLVFYGTSTSNITHVAISNGGNTIVHASSPTQGIIQSNIGNPIAIKRIL